MKIFDFEKFIYRLTILMIAVVFVLLVPTTHIIASWYPGKKDTLWLWPFAAVSLGIVSWLLMRLSIPKFIQWGWFQNRRNEPRQENGSAGRRLWRIALPILSFSIQMFLLIFMCMCLVAFMRSETIEQLLTYMASR